MRGRYLTRYLIRGQVPFLHRTRDLRSDFKKVRRGLISRLTCAYCGWDTVIAAGYCLKCGMKNRVRPTSIFVVHNKRGYPKVNYRRIYCSRCRKLTEHHNTVKGYVCAECGRRFYGR